MTAIDCRPVVLVLTADSGLAATAVRECERLGHIAVTIDRWEVAIEMMEVVPFTLLIVDADTSCQWWLCHCLLNARRTPIAVVTRFLARDGRYRRGAFETGATAYVCKPCTRDRIETLLARVRLGEPRIDISAGAPYSEE